MATLYKTDGQPEEVKPRSGDVFELDELQTIVGGYIEIVRTHSNKAMVINEEGKLKIFLSIIWRLGSTNTGALILSSALRWSSHRKRCANQNPAFGLGLSFQWQGGRKWAR